MAFLIMFFKAKQWTIAWDIISSFVLDFSNVKMADAHVTATRRSKVLTRSIPILWYKYI